MFPRENSDDRRKVKRRTETLIRKADELARLVDGANVYVLVTYPQANAVYNSMLDVPWPPADRHLVHKRSHGLL